MRNRFQILSLDGGGIKGIFSAAILAYLEDDLKTRITDHFDLIVGTSTGGIIALGLGIGMSPAEIVRFYVDKGPTIFPQKAWYAVRQFYRSKYNDSGLEETLKECFKDKLLGESEKRLVIPTYNIGEDDIYLFKTAHDKRLRRDYKAQIWKIAMATCAAPTFFPVCMNVDNHRLIDGGVWANNPTLVGIVEAVSMFKKPLTSIRVLNIGTTSDVKQRPSKLDRGGFWQWASSAVDVVMRSQSIGIYTQSLHLLGSDNLIRINPDVPEDMFKIDKLSLKELMAKAAHFGRDYSPKLQDNFIEHIAEKFEPIYKLK
jgi:patatin-like phospholipase/acyl hydrolase